ncbi:MAG TPA: CPBP family intramembrane glutamic endopeptidase [Solirubrobacteraceae bacterium]|nr:CPBP family intramembrane glutamic endopeptidase [Solirubrobacteraceae bacterium]
MTAVLVSVDFIYQQLGQHLQALPLLGGPLLLVVGITVNRTLPAPAILNWSPFHLRANLALIPVRTRLWPLYVAVLAAVIPGLALLEELVFRYPVHSLLAGVLLGGVAFGFAHLTSLVTLRMCLYLTVIGWLFVVVYVLWGFWAVVLLHASYNLAALGAVVAERLGWYRLERAS